MSKFIDEIVAQKERAQKEKNGSHDPINMGSSDKAKTVNFPVTIQDYEREFWKIRAVKRKKSMARIAKEAWLRELGDPESEEP